MRNRILIACLLLASSLTCLAAGPAAPVQTEKDSVRAFVQAFYDWYLKTTDDQKDGAADIVLAHKPAYLSPELAKALKADGDAAARSPDEVVGLDFDPYLNAQDVCAPYKLGAVRQKGKVYEVEVMGSCADDAPGIPDVVTQLVRRGDSWEFTNFIYPARKDVPASDLLSLLKRYQQDRDKPAK